MKLYTWMDVERLCLMKKEQCPTIVEFCVYPDEMDIFYNADGSGEQAKEELKSILNKNFDLEKDLVRLDVMGEEIPVLFEEADEGKKRQLRPLFEDAIYAKSVYPKQKLNDLICPVIAFHSYKGGVGRTLSLVAFAKAWTNSFDEPQNHKLLIVDADIEAPGLTNILVEQNHDDFSYLDLLTLLQDEQDVDSVVDKCVELMGELLIPIETEEQRVEHFFLPTFRYLQQLYDIYASPNSVAKCRGKEYILAEVLSKIANKVGATAVLVDLRAGISEYSAPLLLDPRVKKYCVTSTSTQSVIGTKNVLKYIAKGLEVNEETNLPTVFLSMVPANMSKGERENIKGELLKVFEINKEKEDLLDNMVVELPFAGELVHLTDIKQILATLKGRDMYFNIERIVAQNYIINQDEKEARYTEDEHKNILKRIHETAENQITAEGNSAAEMLLTDPIKNICSRFGKRIPTTVVRGAKGSGKTFLYGEMLEKKDWFTFCNEMKGEPGYERGGYFLPILAPKNLGDSKLKNVLLECIDNFNDNIEGAKCQNSIYIDNAKKLAEQIAKDEKIDWEFFWETIFTKSVNDELQTLDELNIKLQKQNRKIVFLIDGLEEILRNVSSDENQQTAVSELCQNTLNVISTKYDNVGIVIFLRSDMAQNAITVNYEQFKHVYGYAELKWSSEEALKLAVWLVSQACEEFYAESIPVANASKDIIEKYLEKLWGLKLGKANSNEAYSSRWILAALSDFNGQLQARDIIRFLKYAANPSSKKITYYDRILMPTEIRTAVSECSREKINEIKTEYDVLKPILEKLESLPIEKKKLPMSIDENVISAMEEKSMMQTGFLTRDGDKLYLPEIIRHALGFQYERGARPRVLSLLRL